MDMYMRRKCQECRLKKCLAVGMRPECVVPENQCAMKRREKKAQKEKDKIQTSVCATEIKKEILDLMTCEPPSHPTCPLLPEDILAKCQARNIPPLSYNQLAVIYKLIWYQDGYEQPSEEDLKRIMSHIQATQAEKAAQEAQATTSAISAAATSSSSINTSMATSSSSSLSPSAASTPNGGAVDYVGTDMKKSADCGGSVNIVPEIVADIEEDVDDNDVVDDGDDDDVVDDDVDNERVVLLNTSSISSGVNFVQHHHKLE
ncbi:Ecdysone receptor [Lucilia cuprina]|nr:Ecdysone receptor [Lucilia cuprina]